MDYYSILGIDRTASQSEIKKAYRKLAMKHHPDRGGDTNQLQKINEAYDVLSDPTKRAQYDNPRQEYRFSSNDFTGNPFEDSFAQFFRQPQRPMKNRDIKLGYQLDFKDCFTGKGVTVSYKTFSGSLRSLDVKFPHGIKNGDQIKFSNYGDDSQPSLPNGDLILTIKIRTPQNWIRDGNDVATNVKVNIFDLLLGTDIKVITPEERTISLKIPPGSQPGTTFSVNGYGIPHSKTGRRGNVYVRINADVPKITDQELLEKLEEIRKYIKQNV